ncbi:MAG: hypothetical protein GEU73_13235 [Chloroflexi bacterium]|nr:hypothetical protein [Chloroflexota bacterium]
MALPRKNVIANAPGVEFCEGMNADTDQTLSAAAAEVAVRPAAAHDTRRVSSQQDGALGRPFRVIAFDWDGTAVDNRQIDASRVAGLITELLGLGVWVVVVTGTNFRNIEKQLGLHIPPGRRQGLIVCVNRGSEVYGYTEQGRAVRRWLRTATPDEEQALTAIADVVRNEIAVSTGLEIGIVFNRLNRRKIDLIPLPEWADPPKSSIGELQAAVEERLRSRGLDGTIRDVVALTERVAREHGLPDVRVTSDVKHVELGLTDKGDSIAWIKRELLDPLGIPWSDVLILGDEFGPIAGLPGSDDRLRSGVEDAVVVSVGAEPNGVPARVLHLDGGPATFEDVLADQIRMRKEEAGEPSGGLEDGGMARPLRANTLLATFPQPDPAWSLVASNYVPEVELDVESRFTVSNGAVGVRGSLAVPTPTSRPRTFVAGLFELATTEPRVPALIPAPDWPHLQLWIDGEPVTPGNSRPTTVTRILDMRRGILWTHLRHRTRNGKNLQLRVLRFTSLGDRRLAGQVADVEVDQPADVTLDSWIEPARSELVQERRTAELTVWRTNQTRKRLAMASTVRLQVGGRARRPVAVVSGGRRGQRWNWNAMPGQPAVFTRFTSLVRGESQGDAGSAALATLRRAHHAGLDQVAVAHSRAWDERWMASNVEIEGDEAGQRIIRFATYHLVSAANPDDERVSIGARALTGDAYLGHVFWDTEIFLLPYYTLTWPAAARALLMYRYHTLPAARAKAASKGYRGALYAWESADTGEEVTPPYAVGPDEKMVMIHNGQQEHHISADIAYAVWQYWQATGDDAFLRDAGAEIILETARFWASRAEQGPDGRYHIRGVIGPDEYHVAVDDNAFTNGMAKWNVERGVEAADVLRSRWPDRWADLQQRIELTTDELASWAPVAQNLVTGFDPESGLIEQFDGYLDLNPIYVSGYTPRTSPMDVLIGADQVQRTQVIKQADVVMLLALLPDRFSPRVREVNFRFYEARCGHGSSLSPIIHAIVAARVGDTALALRYFREAAAIDLDDTMGNVAMGIHIAGLGGIWQVMVLGFAGLTLCPDGVRFDPRIPRGWTSLRFPIQWRGRRLRVEIRAEPVTFTATLEGAEPLILYVDELTQYLSPGEAWTCQQDEREQVWRVA